MQRLISEVIGLPVVSLQSGEAIAAVRRPVFDMATLQVLALLCDVPSQRQPLLLIAHDVRRSTTDCLVVDGEEELTEPGDVVRLAPHLEAGYNPQGKSVHTDTGRRLGSIDDYTLDLDIWQLQKLYVRTSVLRSWLGVSLAIDHSQIIEVTAKRVIVRDSIVGAQILPSESLPESPA